MLRPILDPQGVLAPSVIVEAEITLLPPNQDLLGAVVTYLKPNAHIVTADIQAGGSDAYTSTAESLP